MIDIEFIKKNCPEGFHLNDNPKVVNGIIKGLNRCEGECPCANPGLTLDDRICPCKNFRENGHCCCTLYVRD